MATATSKLQIIIDVLNDPGSTRSVQNIKSALTSIAAVTGTVVAAGYAAKQAWDFAKEGAQLELTAQQFRNVAEDAGYLSEVLLNDLRQATGGLVSDAELMQSGLDIIRLGLAEDQQGVVDLANVVTRLGLDMQQVILTFANNSEMRLDALGLSVADVRQRVEELNATGFEGDAFDKAVLEGLTAQMELMGDATETTAGQMQILETSVQNLQDAAKRGFAAAFADEIGNAVSFTTAMDTLTDAYERGIISKNAYLVQLGQLSSDREKNAEILDRLIKLEEEYANSFKNSTNELQKAPPLLSQVEEAYLNTHRAIRDFAIENEQSVTDIINGAGAMENSMRPLPAIVNDLSDVMRGNADAAGDAASQLTVAGKAYSQISTNVYSLTQSLQEQLDFLTAGGGALLELAQTAQEALDEGNFSGAQAALDAAALGAVDLDLELGNITTDEAVARLEDLGYPVDDAIAKVQEFQDSLFALTTKNWVVTVNTVTSGNVPGTSTPSAPIDIAPNPSGIGGEIESAGGVGGRQYAGMGGTTIYVNIGSVLDGADFFEVLANAQQGAGRNARSVAAGAAYVG